VSEAIWPLLITFLLKLGIFPFHQLTADLYDGLPTKIMMIIQLPIKLGLYLFISGWFNQSSIWGLAILIPAISTQYSYTFKRFIS
jgi:NADH:ubiquinone oxidoreductase subunit 2 (subunit N)